MLKARPTSPKCGTLLIMLSCLLIIMNPNYRQCAMRRWRFSERMTEYLDELIRLFRKAGPGTPVSFKDEEVKNQILAGLPAEALGYIKGYLDLSSAKITQKYDLIHSQREALVMNKGKL